MHSTSSSQAGSSQHTAASTAPVLVPVDFSSCSRAALQFAANFMRCINAPLLVLHVVHEAGSEAGFYRRNGTPGTLRPVEDIARDMLQEFVDDVCGDCRDASGPLEPRLLLVSGLPAARIQEIAEREQAGLIVMGTHARTGLARMAAGSVSTEVMQHCRVPVTIVKALPEQGESDTAGAQTYQTMWWPFRSKRSDSEHTAA
ncbi:MAG: universal stress protein [Pseudomonadota bacterium]